MPDRPIDELVDTILDGLSLEEKVAQLSCGCRAYEQADLFPSDAVVDEEAFLARFPNSTGQIGRINLHRSADGARSVAATLQRIVAERARAGIGLLLNEEGLHGLMGPGATVFPSPIAQASTWDPALVERLATATARETRRRGANYVYAPVLDLALDPRWGRVEETFGEDPVLVARLGVAVVHGLQGRPAPDAPGAAQIPADRVLACAKHFVAHGAPQAGLNGAPVDLGPRAVREEHLAPFRAAVEAGVGAIMVAYHELDGVPMHVHEELLTGVLREELGFTGMITSDGFGVPQLARLHHVAHDATDAAARAIAAGLDCEVPEPVGTAGLVDRVRAGDLHEDHIDRAARAVLRAKARLGLLPGQRPAPPTTAPDEDPSVLAREAAEAACVLLEDPARTLPLQRDRLRRVLVTGPNAEHAHLGGYCDPSATGIAVLDGLRSLLGPDVEVLYRPGCRIGESPAGPETWWEPTVRLADPADDDALLDAAEQSAHDVDVVIAVIGGNEATHREGWWFDHLGDRETLTLAGRQDELVERLAATGTPTVAVVISGGPVDLGRVATAADAVLWTGYAGEQGGMAIARVLLGDAVPGGHLPVTFPRSTGHIPVRTARRPSAGRGYLHDPATPRYPVGHGLAYAPTGITVTPGVDSSLTLGALDDGAAFMVDVEVTNEGDHAVVELLTLHVTDEVASVTRPLARLVDLETVRVAPGDLGRVTLRADHGALTLLDRDLVTVVEPGSFTLEVRAAARTVRRWQVEVRDA